MDLASLADPANILIALNQIRKTKSNEPIDEWPDWMPG